MHVIESGWVIEVVRAAYPRVEFNSLTVTQNRRQLAFADKQAHMHTRARFQFQSELIAIGGDCGRLDHAAGNNHGSISLEFGRAPWMAYHGDHYACCQQRNQRARSRKPARMTPECDESQNDVRRNDQGQLASVKPNQS